MIEMILAVAIVPLIVAGAAGLTAPLLRQERLAAAIVALAVAAGFLIAFTMLNAIPVFPPPTAAGKVFYASAFGAAGVALLVLMTGRNRPVMVFAAAVVVAGGGWIAWRMAMRGDAEMLIALAGWAVAMLLAGWGLRLDRPAAHVTRARLGMFCFGLGLICMLSGNALIGTMALAMAVSIAFSITAEGRIGARLDSALTGTAFVMAGLVACQTALFSGIEPLPLAVAALIVPAGRAAEAVGWPSGLAGHPMLVAIRLAIPPGVVAAGAVAAALASGGGSPY